MLSYGDAIAIQHSGMRLSQFASDWDRKRRSNGHETSESSIIMAVVRKINSLMEELEISREYMKVYSLLRIYQDRCARVHKQVRYKSEQSYWDFLKLVEQKVSSGKYRFNIQDAKSYVLRTVQIERERHYEWGSDGVLLYKNNNVVVHR